MKEFVFNQTSEHILFRYTTMNKRGWSSPMWIRKIVGWVVMVPAMLFINLAVFSLTGRWLHAMWQEKDRFFEYVPVKDYTPKESPKISFEGYIRDTNLRLNKE